MVKSEDEAARHFEEQETLLAKREGVVDEVAVLSICDYKHGTCQKTAMRPYP